MPAVGEQHRPFGRSFGKICSLFELADGALGQGRIAVQVMGVEDRADIRQAVSGDRCYLRLGTAGHGEPGYGSAAQVVKSQADDADSGACLAPGRTASVLPPGLVV